MVEFRQGFRSMAAPTRELETLIVSRQLVHGGNPITRWMPANVAVAQDPAGNLKPAKDKSTDASTASWPSSWRSAAPCSPARSNTSRPHCRFGPDLRTAPSQSMSCAIPEQADPAPCCDPLQLGHSPVDRRIEGREQRRAKPPADRHRRSAARGSDLAVLSKLLPAEGGLVVRLRPDVRPRFDRCPP